MPSPDDRLAQLLAQITDDLQGGRQPNIDALVQANPDLAEDLRALWTAVLVAEGAAVGSGAGRGSRSSVVALTLGGGNFPAELLTDSRIDGLTGVAGVIGSRPKSTDERPLRTFGDYELLEEIGRGGMGVVYRARQVSLDRIVALKMILRGELATPTELARFRAEAQAVARLDHPHIVPVYEVGEYDRQPYFTMKYVAGSTLSRRLADGPMSARDAAELLAPVADAVHYAHQNGILHRDLKPSNILLDEEGRPHVTDFGLAKRFDVDVQLTQSGAMVGTPCHMSPEQASGSRVQLGPTCDVYSLGTILYQMLTGRPPFQAASPVDTVLMVLEQDPVPPRLLNARASRELEMIALKCLQKPPELRYASAALLAADLRAFLADEPIAARSGLITQIVARWLSETHHATVLENWGLLWMWHSLALLIISLATNWLQWRGESSPLPYLGLWIAGLGTWAAIFWALRHRAGPVTFVERQIAHLWAGSMASIALLFLVEMLLGLPVLTLSPVLALSSGTVFLVKAGMLSGSFYLQAVALYATALVMALLQRERIELSITLFGVVSAASFFFPGLKYYRRKGVRGEELE